MFKIFVFYFIHSFFFFFIFLYFFSTFMCKKEVPGIHQTKNILEEKNKIKFEIQSKELEFG